VSEPRQFRKDPATGQLVEDVLPPVRVDVDDDDASEPDAPTDLELAELPPVSDPPGGEQ